MKYTLAGNPIPLARPRFSRGRVYNSQASIQTKCTLDLMKQHNKQPLLTGALHLEIEFLMKMPDSWSHAKKERMIGQPHIYKPDLSNLIKWIEDCCSLVIYKDDCLIHSISAIKIYDWSPRTEFIITEIKL